MLEFLAQPRVGWIGPARWPFGPFRFRGAHESSGLALGWRRFSGYFRLSGPLNPSVGDGLIGQVYWCYIKLVQDYWSSLQPISWFDRSNDIVPNYHIFSSCFIAYIFCRALWHIIYIVVTLFSRFDLRD